MSLEGTFTLLQTGNDYGKHHNGLGLPCIDLPIGCPKTGFKSSGNWVLPHFKIKNSNETEHAFQYLYSHSRAAKAMTYPPEFIARVKAAFYAPTIHKLCDENSPFLGRCLCDMQGDGIKPQTILDMGDLEEIQALARLEIERTNLWRDWQKTEIGKAQGF